MWVVKFQFDGSNILYGKTAKKFDAEAFGYILSVYEKNKGIYVTSVGRFSVGRDKAKKVINFLKKDKTVIKIEQHGDFFIVLVREQDMFRPFFNSSFIYVSPVVINNKGNYTYHLASWYRQDLEKLLKHVSKFPRFNLLSIKEEKIRNLSITGIQPDFTDKQRKVYELAVEKGYYNYPKKITLKELAKMFGVSYSTFQQHLSYAEKKMGRFFLGKMYTVNNR
jgi:predicted DNA binding protein